MRSFVCILLLSSAVFFSMPSFSKAQLTPTQTLTLLLSPEYPRPYDTVAITPKSNQINLSASEVVVYVDGVVVERGSGERKVFTTLKGPGTQTTIKVVATVDGVSYEAETRIRPADVSLIVEPTTSTHPLYKGSALPAPKGPVRLVALADFRNSSGTRIPSSALSYTWRLGNKILTQDSGLGRTVLTATAPVQFRDADVSVTVTTADDAMAAKASVEVTPRSPFVFAYRADPLLGIDLAHKLSGSLLMRAEEETFEAVPFNFGALPTVSWTLNQASAGTQNSLTVRTDTGGNGIATVGFSAVDQDGASAQGNFSLLFDTRTRNMFGF